MENDKLDFNFINSLGQFYGSLSGTYWPVLDMCVETGLTRIDVCGKMQICDITDFLNFKDETGKIYEVDDFYLDGDEPAYVDMPIWYTHNIKNIGEDILYTIFWINEPFDANDPDTYFEIV